MNYSSRSDSAEQCPGVQQGAARGRGLTEADHALPEVADRAAMA
jgi:hypothetical protein